jgi:hypothetical protein
MSIVMAMLVLIGGAMVAAQQAPQLPPPFSTPSSTNRPVVVEAPAGARLQVPAEAAGKKPLITGLKRAYGLALWRNYLYVAETESVKLLVSDDGGKKIWRVSYGGTKS